MKILSIALAAVLLSISVHAQVPARQIRVDASGFTALPTTVTNLQLALDWQDANMLDYLADITAASNAISARVESRIDALSNLTVTAVDTMSNQVVDAQNTFCTNGFLAEPSDVQGLSINAANQLTFSNQVYDNGPGENGEFNSSVFTPAAAGLWMIGGVVNLSHASGSPTNRAVLALYKDTTLYSRLAEVTFVSNTTYSVVSGSAMISVNAGSAYDLRLVTEGDKPPTNAITSRFWGVKMRSL